MKKPARVGFFVFKYKGECFDPSKFAIMKKLNLFFVLMLPLFCFAHTENEVYKKVSVNFEQFYNAGLCGKSGNSSEAHLHFHIQNVEDMNKENEAKAYFEEINVNGELKVNHSPTKGEEIRNK